MKYVFTIDPLSDQGFAIITAESEEKAKARVAKIGVYPVYVESCALVLEQHRGLLIIQTAGTIMVFNPAKNTRFIVCMDDSKTAGCRTFDDSSNTIEAAREYIETLVPDFCNN